MSRILGALILVSGLFVTYLVFIDEPRLIPNSDILVVVAGVIFTGVALVEVSLGSILLVKGTLTGKEGR